jgi:GLPGLI family protein
MKKTLLFFSQLFFLVLFSHAQTNSVCLVKYKDYKTNLGTYNYWYSKDKLISMNEPNLKNMYSKGFPVIINGVMTTQTDTVKYKKEFYEFLSDVSQQMKSRKERVIYKDYASDIIKTSVYLYDVKKNYIVVDTLVKMDNWELLNETKDILSYKCQKAVITYKGEKFYAWFATQLAYNAGPDGFRGLPGLILKVSNTAENMGFEAIEIEVPHKGMIPQFDEVGEVISQTEWIKIANESIRKSREAAENRRKQLQKENEKQNF